MCNFVIWQYFSFLFFLLFRQWYAWAFYLPFFTTWWSRGRSGIWLCHFWPCLRYKVQDSNGLSAITRTTPKNVTGQRLQSKNIGQETSWLTQITIGQIMYLFKIIVFISQGYLFGEIYNLQSIFLGNTKASQCIGIIWSMDFDSMLSY